MPLKVGVIRDERFVIHQGGSAHPGWAERLGAVYAMLDRDFPEGLEVLNAEPAALDVIELVHTREYVERVLKSFERRITYLSPDTAVAPDESRAAWLATGGCIKAVHALFSGRLDACFALIHPPGHRARPDGAADRCIFNHTAIVARYAVDRCGLQRILVLDWGPAHGRELQDRFFRDRSILSFSTQRRTGEPFTGDWGVVGSGEGLGYSVNVPMPAETGNDELTFVYWKLLGSILRNFKPEFILVVAGFNGDGNTLGNGPVLTEAAYRNLTEIIVELRDPVRTPPVLFVLESGSDPAVLARGVRAVLNVLTFRGKRRMVTYPALPSAMELVEAAEAVHRKFRVWIE